MAKVGSSSTYIKLRELGLEPIHFHWINNAAGLSSLIEHRKYKTSFKIITMARDPVARNLSGFWAAKHRRPNKQTLKHLLRDYNQWLKSEMRMQPLIWFDNQLKKYFGVNVYQTTFPKERGYETYKKDNIEVLVMRTEDLTKVAPQAVSNFLDIDFGSLRHLNSGKKPGIYKKFKQHLKMPKKYLDEMYNSKYARHFYTDNEIESFYRKWHH